MKGYLIGLVLLALSFRSGAQGWQFLGPDSVNWRNIVQMDVAFRAGSQVLIGAATGEGVCLFREGHWRYSGPDYPGNWYWDTAYCYRSFYFSPWNDAVGFVGSNLFYTGEPGSAGSTVDDIFLQQWLIGGEIGGGYVGNSPSLGFAFSPHRPGHVYTWIIDFYKSSDGGASWDYQMHNDSYGAYALTFDELVDSVLYVCRKRYSQDAVELFRSTDDGDSWTAIRQIPLNYGTNSQRQISLLAAADNLVLAISRYPQAADSSTGITVSNDGGLTWNRTLPQQNVQQIIRDTQSPEILFAAAQGGIYRSTNHGSDWQHYANNLPSLNLVDIRQDPQSDTFYVATADMGVYKLFDFRVGIAEAATVPDIINLGQNYPNPFNPNTVIRYSLSVVGRVRLAVYDVSGQKMRTLVSENKAAGSYEIQWDGRNDAGQPVASGIYIYRLSADGNNLSRRMLLIR